VYDPLDDRGVPVSSGIPSLVVYSGIAGVILIFVIAALVLSQAGFGHVWPAEDSLHLKL
jgi:hypothetical protein